MAPTGTSAEVAAGAAHGFKVFECVECATAIKRALQAAGHSGQWLEIRGAGRRPYMVCISFDGGAATITQNGKHIAVRVGDRAFDNLHPQGMPFEQWLGDFDAIGGVEITAEAAF